MLLNTSALEDDSWLPEETRHSEAIFPLINLCLRGRFCTRLADFLLSTSDRNAFTLHCAAMKARTWHPRTANHLIKVHASQNLIRQLQRLCAVADAIPTNTEGITATRNLPGSARI